MGAQQGIMQYLVLSDHCFCNTQGHLLIYRSQSGMGGQSNTEIMNITQVFSK